MFQFAPAGFETLGDFAKGAGSFQLTKEHSDELAPAGKTSRVPFVRSLPDQFLKFISWKES
jgi:hypothetical protein